MYTNISMVHMGIITHHSPLYEGNDQVAMAIQTFIIPLHSFNTSNEDLIQIFNYFKNMNNIITTEPLRNITYIQCRIA